MTEQEYGKIIAKNLKRLAYEHNKTQTDIANDLGISKTTLSSWMSGYRTPIKKAPVFYAGAYPKGGQIPT